MGKNEKEMRCIAQQEDFESQGKDFDDVWGSNV
jgi:hypothetical protein